MMGDSLSTKKRCCILDCDHISDYNCEDCQEAFCVSHSEDHCEYNSDHVLTRIILQISCESKEKLLNHISAQQHLVKLSISSVKSDLEKIKNINDQYCKILGDFEKFLKRLEEDKVMINKGMCVGQSTYCNFKKSVYFVMEKKKDLEKMILDVLPLGKLTKIDGKGTNQMIGTTEEKFNVDDQQLSHLPSDKVFKMNEEYSNEMVKEKNEEEGETLIACYPCEDNESITSNNEHKTNAEIGTSPIPQNLKILSEENLQQSVKKSRKKSKKIKKKTSKNLERNEKNKLKLQNCVYEKFFEGFEPYKNISYKKLKIKYYLSYMPDASYIKKKHIKLSMSNSCQILIRKEIQNLRTLSAISNPTNLFNKVFEIIENQQDVFIYLQNSDYRINDLISEYKLKKQKIEKTTLKKWVYSLVNTFSLLREKEIEFNEIGLKDIVINEKFELKFGDINYFPIKNENKIDNSNVERSRYLKKDIKEIPSEFDDNDQFNHSSMRSNSIHSFSFDENFAIFNRSIAENMRSNQEIVDEYDENSISFVVELSKEEHEDGVSDFESECSGEVIVNIETNSVNNQVMDNYECNSQDYLIYFNLAQIIYQIASCQNLDNNFSCKELKEGIESFELDTWIKVLLRSMIENLETDLIVKNSFNLLSQINLNEN